MLFVNSLFHFCKTVDFQPEVTYTVLDTVLIIADIEITDNVRQYPAVGRPVLQMRGRDFAAKRTRSRNASGKLRELEELRL